MTFMTSAASAMRASCTSPTRMRSFCRSVSASRASTSASARCGASRRIWSGAPFSIVSASQPGSADAYAFTCLDFEKAAHRFGKLGGFAHLKTLIDRLRSDAGRGRSLLLDGGDLWQGTGLANAMQGADMVDAANLLGIEAMTGHWEFTYGEKTLRANLDALQGRIPGAECLPDRGSRLQRRQGIRSRPRAACSSRPPSRRSAAIASP